MRHYWIVAAFALGFCGTGCATLTAQEPVLLSVGDTVRLRGGLPLFTGVVRTERGILTGRSRDTLMLAPLDGSSARPWLLRPDSRLSVKRGERSFGVWKGALLGTAIFAAGGLIYENSQSREEQGCVVVDRSVNGSPIYRCEKGRREAGVLVLPVGAIVGGLAGHLLRRDRWVHVDREMLELTAERTEGSFHLSVRVAF